MEALRRDVGAERGRRVVDPLAAPRLDVRELGRQTRLHDRHFPDLEPIQLAVRARDGNRDLRRRGEFLRCGRQMGFKRIQVDRERDEVVEFSDRVPHQSGFGADSSASCTNRRRRRCSPRVLAACTAPSRTATG